MTKEFQNYLETTVRDMYKKFDPAHDERHFDEVYDFTKEYASKICPESYDVLLVAAAFHDTGLIYGREPHEVMSCEVVDDDEMIHANMTHDDIAEVKNIIKHHRKSKYRDDGLALEYRFLRQADSASGLSRFRSLYRVCAFNNYHYDTESFESLHGRVRAQLIRKPLGFRFSKRLPELEGYGLEEVHYTISDAEIDDMLSYVRSL